MIRFPAASREPDNGTPACPRAAGTARRLPAAPSRENEAGFPHRAEPGKARATERGALEPRVRAWTATRGSHASGWVRQAQGVRPKQRHY